jgi:branched-chain amino acid transport system ATP-binding protein
MKSQSVLQIRNLDVHYGDLQAIWNADLDIEKGRIVSIIGANGAGKSTLLKTIAGTLTPSSGEILYEGDKINHLRPYQTLTRGLSLVPEGRRIFPRLTVLENLLIGAYIPAARQKHKQTLEKVLALFPILKERSNQLGTNLSGGEQQMLAIGRSLMSDPKVILFDEISLGLAPVVIKNIYASLKEINRSGLTMVLVEQDIKRSMKAADYVYIMQEGRVVLQGNPDQMTEDQVKKAYFGI